MGPIKFTISVFTIIEFHFNSISFKTNITIGFNFSDFIKNAINMYF